MIKDIIAKRYAKALLSLAEPAGRSEDVRADLAAVAAHYDASRDLQSVFLNPSFGLADKSRVLGGLMDTLGSNDLSRRFLDMLAVKRRFRYIREVASAYNTLLDLRQGKIKATVTAVEPLSDEHVSRLKDRVRTLVGKEVELDVEVDPSLIGGVRTRIGSTVYDGSIKNQMARIKEELLSG